MRSFFVFVVACSFVLVAACSSVTTSTPLGGDSGADAGVDPDASSDDASADAAIEAEGGACVSGLMQPNDACMACQDSRCCTTASACAAKPSTWSCSAATVCRQNACATECGTAPATCGNIIPDPASCTAATRAACCNELTACGASDECVALIYLCIDGMNCAPGQPCFATCRKNWPNGAKLFDALDACSQNVSCP